jgi:hypothetical protein
MSLRSKPVSSKELPPAITDWAKSADSPNSDKKGEAPGLKPIEKKPAPETKVQVSFRLAPTIQWRIKMLAVALSSPSIRVTSQDLMEKAVLKFLAENENP